MKAIFLILTGLLALLYNRSAWNFSASNKLRANPVIEPVTEIDTLPLTVQKWLKANGAHAKDPIKSVRLKQSGLMKLKPEQAKWIAVEAEQQTVIDPPSFLWTVEMKPNPLLRIAGRDSFQDGKAQMLIKLAALVPVSQVSDNAKTNESALQRFLMEMAWYPAAALSPHVTWKDVDETTAEATMSYKGITGSAAFHIDEQGNLVKVVASRFKDSDEQAQRYPCVATIKSTIEVDGFKVPSEIEITWLLEDGPFTWYKFKVHDIEFDF